MSIPAVTNELNVSKAQHSGTCHMASTDSCLFNLVIVDKLSCVNISCLKTKP